MLRGVDWHLWSKPSGGSLNGLGDDVHVASHTEKWLSAIGGFVAILTMMLVTPSLLDMQASLLVVATLFNFPFAWRRYPRVKARFQVGEKCMIAHSDMVYALTQIDTFIDVSEEDLLRIYSLALGHQTGIQGDVAVRRFEPVF